MYILSVHVHVQLYTQWIIEPFDAVGGLVVVTEHPSMVTVACFPLTPTVRKRVITRCVRVITRV